MTKKVGIKTAKDPPNAKQLLRILSGKRTDLDQALGDIAPDKLPKTYKEVSAIIGCSVYKVKKLMNGILDHANNDFKDLDIWGRRGRPSKDLNLTSESLQYIINRDTLRMQTGWTLTERAIHANNLHQVNLNKDDVRKIYYKHRITK